VDAVDGSAMGTATGAVAGTEARDWRLTNPYVCRSGSSIYFLINLNRQ
jgi:hypothetical protein